MCLVLSPLYPTLTWVNKYEQWPVTLTTDDFDHNLGGMRVFMMIVNCVVCREGLIDVWCSNSHLSANWFKVLNKFLLNWILALKKVCYYYYYNINFNPYKRQNGY